jgi:hypothetical protein
MSKVLVYVFCSKKIDFRAILRNTLETPLASPLPFSNAKPIYSEFQGPKCSSKIDFGKTPSLRPVNELSRYSELVRVSATLKFARNPAMTGPTPNHPSAAFRVPTPANLALLSLQMQRNLLLTADCVARHAYTNSAHEHVSFLQRVSSYTD